jgi:predicted methyltransferase
MTYYINVNAQKEQDFLILLQTLKNMGVLDSFESSKSLAVEGEEVTSELLLQVLEKSKSEIKEGQSFSLKDVLNKVEEWKKK